MDDLLTIKAVIDPAAATPGALLVKTLSLLPVLFEQMGGGGRPSQSQRPTSEDTSPAKKFAASVAGENKRNEIEELVGNFLDAIDKEVLRQLDDGVEDERLIRTADFAETRGNGLVLLERNDGTHLQAGLLNYLPDEQHPLRQWPVEFLYEYDHKPAIVLGPPTTSAFGGAGHPRPFYAAEAAQQWTRTLRLQQLRQRRESPHLDPDQFRVIVETLKLVEGKLPPRPSAGSPAPSVNYPAGWRTKTLLALDVLQRPHRVFVAPEEGTSLDDLLAVRELLGVREDEQNPNMYAAKRFASRAVGEVRKSELVDLLHPMLNALDRSAVLEIDRAITWACRESTKEARK